MVKHLPPCSAPVRFHRPISGTHPMGVADQMARFRALQKYHVFLLFSCLFRST